MSIPSRFALLATAAVAASPLPGAAQSPPSGAPATQVVADFAARLERALLGGPGELDDLWAEGSRDSTRQALDLRAASLFEWSDVRVTVESAASVHERDEEYVVVDLLVSGSAAWHPRAWGVARAFWSLQVEESSETNRVVRRESWRLRSTAAGWRAVERVRLAAVEVVEARVEAGVYPDVLLVDCSYYLRALADGVGSLRFLLDPRSFVYKLEVDGHPVDLVRGSATGGLGLEGFSPAIDGSLRLPEPLTTGKELLVKFQIRSPLVHMEGDGFVTSLPFRDGPYRERAWYPILPPAYRTGTRPEPETLELVVRWPEDAFAEVALSGDVAGPPERDERVEESVARSSGSTPRGADFLLFRAPGHGAEWSEVATVEDGRLRRLPPDTGRLDADPRSRAVLVGALLAEAAASSRDLDSEIQELLPLDADLDEDTRDGGEDSAGDADGADQSPD